MRANLCILIVICLAFQNTFYIIFNTKEIYAKKKKILKKIVDIVLCQKVCTTIFCEGEKLLSR